MTATPTDIVRDFYAKLGAGDAPGALGLMAPEGESVVSLGEFVGVHGATGKTSQARYAHAWTVKDGRIARFRQYIDTLAVAGARRP